MRQSRWARLWQQRETQLMVWLGIGFLLVFAYVPLYGLIMSLQEYDLGDLPGFSRWVGLRQFRSLFTDPMLPIVVKNTLGISLSKMLFTFPGPILLALMFNEIKHKRTQKLVQTVSYLPHFISWVVASGMIFDLLRVDGGSINELRQALSPGAQPIFFMGQPSYFWPILIVSDLWKEIGWNSIIFVSAMTAVDPALYEAAEIDGANRLQKMWHITLGCIRPTIVVLLIFHVGGLLNANFDQVMMLTNQMSNPLLSDVAETLETYVYRMGVKLSRYSYATAAELVKSVISFLMLFGANWLAGRLGEDGVM